MALLADVVRLHVPSFLIGIGVGGVVALVIGFAMGVGFMEGDGE